MSVAVTINKTKQHTTPFVTVSHPLTTSAVSIYCIQGLVLVKWLRATVFRAPWGPKAKDVPTDQAYMSKGMSYTSSAMIISCTLSGTRRLTVSKTDYVVASC